MTTTCQKCNREIASLDGICHACSSAQTEETVSVPDVAAREWFYASGQQRLGPVAEAILVEKIESGELSGETKIWTKGLAKWILVKNSDFQEHFPENQPPPIDEDEADTPSMPPEKEVCTRSQNTKPRTTLSPKMMFCRNCGKQVSEMSIACPACGVPPRTQKNFCPHCGKPTLPVQAVCTQCGVSLETAKEKGKVPAGILALCLGGLGAHKFYLGYTGEAVFMLCISIVAGALTMGMAYVLMAIIGVVEGVIYLTKSDHDFAATYIQNKKTWF